jgi:predicted XRE-type DNA-binding protein
MDTATRTRLEQAGFRKTNVQELLGLTREENEMIETRLALARLVKELRRNNHFTQKHVAEMLRSDQGNVSKAEKSDPNISIEWLLKAAFTLGATREQIGKALCG